MYGIHIILSAHDICDIEIKAPNILNHILNNINSCILLKQGANNYKALQNRFDITDEHLEYLKNCIHGEGLFLINDEFHPYKKLIKKEYIT
jgi:hypothetical protein